MPTSVLASNIARRVLRYTQVTAAQKALTPVLLAGATATIFGIGPCTGFSVLRVEIYSDVAGTVNLLQKESLGTFRQTDSAAVAAATAFSQEFLLTGEYFQVQYVNGGANQTTFTVILTLLP